MVGSTADSHATTRRVPWPSARETSPSTSSTTLIDEREIDTVIVAFTDMQGRLVGKRVSARLFQEEIAEHGAECCNYLLAVDVEMNTVDGYAISSWETRLRRHGDDPRLRHPAPRSRGCPARRSSSPTCTGSTRRRSSPSPARDPQAPDRAPRRARPHAPSSAPSSSSSSSTTPTARPGRRATRDLTPASDYNIDYALLASTRMEPLLRDIRLGMEGAGMYCEGVKGECNLGQQEIAFRYDRRARHLRQPLDLQERCEGDRRPARQGAHLHGEVQRARGQLLPHPPVGAATRTATPVMAGDGEHGFSKLMEHCIAGQLATMRELTLFFAPNINSYKRYVEGSFAPTAVAWGLDNRTCALRVVGTGRRCASRTACRAATSTSTSRSPRSSRAACTASRTSSSSSRSSRATPTPRMRRACRRRCARRPRCSRESEIAREAFGDEVVEHYLNNARVEQAAFDAADHRLGAGAWF